MRAALLALPLAVLATACAGPESGIPRPGSPTYGEPSDIIAAELGVARLAREKGAVAALRASAAPGARVQSPASASLLGVEEATRTPTTLPKTDARAVWMSCDGTIAVSRGVWSGDKTNGWYVTVWQRQKAGAYRWLLGLSGDGGHAEAAPEMISASLADCPPRRPHAAPPKPEAATPAPVDVLNGESRDHTLAWSATMAPAGSGISLRLKQEGQMREVLHITPGTPPR